MEHWDELRTALHVARAGTVSGAATALGVHHATVIRHVDALEERMGVKLFQRHSRGYMPTEAGEDLLRVGQAAEEQFLHLESRLKGQGEEVRGDLTVTTLVGFAPAVTMALVPLMKSYPDLKVRLESGERLFRMEYGEAHVAVRVGVKPDHPDNVVQPLCNLTLALYASRSYIQEHGLPETEGDFSDHAFLGALPPASQTPFNRWLDEHPRISRVVFRTLDERSKLEAIKQGVGIGFLPVSIAEAEPDLVQVQEPREDWVVPLWLVTHVDLHRTAKVQVASRQLKKELPRILMQTDFRATP